MGLIKDNVLTILSPKQQIKQFQLKLNKKEGVLPEFQIYYDQIPLKSENKDLADETIAFYQSASYVLKKKEYQFNDLSLTAKNTKLYAKVR